MPLHSANAQAIYYGWAFAHASAAVVLMPIITQRIDDPGAIAPLEEALAALAALECPVRPTPPGADQVEAGVADFYQRLQALAAALGAGSRDIAPLLDELGAAADRLRGTVVQFGDLLQGL